MGRSCMTGNWRRNSLVPRSCIALAMFMLIAVPRSGQGADSPAASRGEYLFHAAGCAGCHTSDNPKGQLLAGGRRLDTPFGAFYPPNITPDPEHGIGRWEFGDFVRAMREGKGPDGTIYFPAFPYPSYTGMSDADLSDLWVYLKTVPPVAAPAPGHDLNFPFNIRALVWPWRWLYFNAGEKPVDAARPEPWRRGAYLVRAVAHCGECHTPRNFLGGPENGRELAGNPNGPDGKRIPDITPNEKNGIGAWTVGDIESYLEMGILPDGDFAGGAMVEVIENSTSKMTPEDRKAVATYIKSVPASGAP
jgi:mono/diheme cytochrome c family protein